jgi:hypothetical protein
LYSRENSDAWSASTGEGALRPQDPFARRRAQVVLNEIDESGARSLPRYVLEALRGYLRCGVVSHGFPRLHGEGRAARAGLC